MQTEMATAQGRQLGSSEVLVIAAIALLSALVVALPMPPREDTLRGTRGFGDYRCSEVRGVYRGTPALARNPCCVSADRVYAHIPAYREILGRGLTPDKPRYHFLMREASRDFAKAVRAMARRHGHDVVAETGVLIPKRAGVRAPPDRTAEVLVELAR